MVGLNKPSDYAARDPDEEGQSLLLSPNSGSGSGGGRSRRGLGAYGSGGGGGVWPRIYKFGAIIVGSLVLVAVYQYGRGRGYELEIDAEGGLHSDVDESDLYEKQPEVSKADAVPATAKEADADAPTDPPFPTYKPTPPATPTIPAPAADAPTDPPFPTYKPTPPATPTTPSEPAATPEVEATPKEDTAESETESGAWVPEPNPYVDKFNTTEWNELHKRQWEARTENAILIKEKYGTYCPGGDAEPMCPALTEEGAIADVENPEKLAEGPSVKCEEAGTKARCGPGPGPWLNKTIWPLIRGPFCAGQDEERTKASPLPDELRPYFDLGYDRADPTKSVDAEPFDGGTPDPKKEIKVPFDFAVAREHFVKFEAMLEHYYEGLARSLLERQLLPRPEDKTYSKMLKAYADQISRVIVRAANEKEGGALKKMVVGVLGDSVTSGTDNCYYDAWPEQFRRQMSPLFAAMGVEVEVRNAGKNGGHALPTQMLCAHDMLGAADRPDDAGLDFLFQCNYFVKGDGLDAEHMVRRALLGDSHTVVSITTQNGMDANAMLERYASAGLTVGTIWMATPPEMGIPSSGYKFWFPAVDRSFWGMQGDGFCHLTTRGASAPIVNRNWHWGPKLHQTYADAYGLLFSRAARLAIDELSAGRTAPEPPKAKDFEVLLAEETYGIKEDTPPNWRQLIYDDMSRDESVSKGLGGVRCAVGLANQAGSTLLPHWLRSAEGSPFEEKMKARNGTTFVPTGHDAEGSKFYKVTRPITNRNNGAVEVGSWVANPKTFGAESPRTAAQCNHVDGSTLVASWPKPDKVSWLVWEVPKGVVSIGRAMMCPGVKNEFLGSGGARSHYAVPDGNGDWRVFEDAHKSKPATLAGACSTLFLQMEDADLKAAKEGGMWVAVEWNTTAIAGFTNLVAM